MEWTPVEAKFNHIVHKQLDLSNFAFMKRKPDKENEWR